ncbi:MAG TPA: hypothetical protein VFV38_42975 [Ktedonobacteraceae bacterium]|nr:hypothetical protein [Ktedonobacteraceae bacterium]
MLHRRKVPFFLLPALFLVPVFLFILVSLALVGLYAQSFTPSPHGGLGGAYGAVSYALPASATATVTPTAPPVVVQPKMYGGSGAKGACVGTSGAGNNMIKMDFGWPASFLSTQWKDYARYRLCNDHYIWEEVTGLPLQKVLQILHWPPDLLLPQYANQIVVLQPLRSFDPNTLQALQAQQQASGQSTESNKNCLWHVSFAFLNADIDICQPIRLLVGAASSGIRSIYQNTTAQIDFLWQTPLKPFQDDKTSGLLTIWSTSWAIVLACITAVLAYGALRYMLGSVVNWLAYANLAELLPRLLFGLLAAYFSKEFFIMLIQANNVLAGIFNHGSLDTVINGKASGVVDESLQIVYGLLGFLLIIEEAGRVATIYLLFAFAPVLFFLASLRETQRWAKTAATASMIFVFMQAIQAATLDVGGRVLATVLHSTEGQLGFLNLLVSLTILYVALILFFVLARMALGVGGGMFVPAARGVYRFGRWGIPIAAAAVGNTAAAYRKTRRNLFPLPPRYPLTWDKPSSSNQTSVTIGTKPFISNGNRSGGSGGPAGPGGNLMGGPGGLASSGGPRGNLPGGSGTSGAKAIQPAGGSSASGGVVSTPTTRHGQWQKTPLARRPASGFDLINRQRNLNNAQTNQALKQIMKDRGRHP